MNKRMKIIGGLLISGVVVLAGLAWFLGLFSSEPEEASVAEATDALAAETGAVDGVSFDTASITDLSGTWTIEPSEATYVGYRVQEVLSSIGDFTAVGRTPLVTGSLEADWLTITSVSVHADLTGLASDSGARDGQVKKQGLETATFPDGIFELTSPIEVGAIPTEGELFTADALGDLTIHGETREVTVSIEGTVKGGRLVVIGSADILMSDFGIEAPSAPIVASIDDEAVFEFSLIFARN